MAFRFRRSRRWPPVVAVAAVALVGAVIFEEIGRAQDGSSRCQRTKQGPPAELEGELPARLKMDEDEVTELSFGRSRGAKFLDLVFDLDGTGPRPDSAVQFVVRTFRSVEGTAELPRGQVEVIRAQVSRAGKEVGVEFCVDPARPNGVPAGRYMGKIRVDDPAFEPAEFPLAVSLQHGSIFLPMGLAALALFSAACIQSLVSHLKLDETAQRQADEKARLFKWGRLTRSRRFYEFWFGVASGFFPVLLVYVSRYDSNATWSPDTEEVVGFFLAAFAAASATYPTAIALARGVPRASVIESWSLGAAPPGSILEIRGRSLPRDSAVKFDQSTLAEVLEANSNRIRVRVPDLATGEYEVRVKTAAGDLGSTTFRIGTS